LRASRGWRRRGEGGEEDGREERIDEGEKP